MAPGAELRFRIAANDPNGDPLTLRWSGAPRGATLDLQNGNFYWKPTAQQAGSYRVTFEVADNQGLKSSETITITVSASTAGNRAPVITPIGNKSVDVDKELRFTISAADPDNDVMTLSWNSPPPGAQLDFRSGQFYWKPRAEHLGSYQVTFIVTDGRGGRASETIKITVGGQANHVPVISPIGNQTVRAGSELHFRVQATDADGDTMYLSWAGYPPGATLNYGTGEVYWKPTQADIGKYSVAFQVKDTRNGIATETISITVTN